MQCVGIVFFDNYIWIDYVVYGFIYFFYCLFVDIFFIFQDKFSIVIFRMLCFESFYIQNIVGYNIYIYMQWSGFVLVFQV